MTFQLLSCINTLSDSETLRAFFFQNQCYDVINETTISWECNAWFQKERKQKIKIELKKNSHLGNSKKLNFWPNWSLLMCWVTYWVCNKASFKEKFLCLFNCFHSGTTSLFDNFMYGNYYIPMFSKITRKCNSFGDTSSCSCQLTRNFPGEISKIM